MVSTHLGISALGPHLFLVYINALSNNFSSNCKLFDDDTSQLCHFYEIFSKKFFWHLFNLIPNFNRVHNTKLSYNIPPIKVRHDHFKNSFFPSVWNKLELNIRRPNTFKEKLLKFIRPCANSIFHINNPLGIKLLIRLRQGLSHLHEHKFRHCFQDTFNPL